MGKRIFWIFVLFVTSAVTITVSYIHSESFAKILKQQISTHFSNQVGLKIEFERVNIGFLPPSLTLLDVDIKVINENNAIGLKADTVFHAEKFGFSFPMIQAFSRGIIVNEVFLTNANIDLEIPKANANKKNKTNAKLSDYFLKPIYIAISKNFSIIIRQLEINETKLALKLNEQDYINIGKLHYLAITPESRQTNIVLNFEEANFRVDNIHQNLAAIKLNADIKKEMVIVSSLDIQREQAALHASGELRGSLDHLDQMKPDLALVLRGNNLDLSDVVPALKKINFQFSTEAKLRGTMDDPEVSAHLDATKVQYSNWEVDHIRADLKYANHNINVHSVNIEKNNGSLQLADDLNINLPLRKIDQNVVLHFTNFRIQDFAGDLKKNINNLRGTINGDLSARIKLDRVNSELALQDLVLQSKFDVDDFELNNQAFGKTRPYKTIFKLKKFALNTETEIQGKQFKVNGGDIVFQSGKIALSGGINSGQFDLNGKSSSIDLGGELGAIAAIPVSGAGPLSIHVRGPGEAVMIDFDIDQRAAKFVNFDFGQLTGRVTYDDDRSYLYLKNLLGKKNNSTYSLNGEVNIGAGDEIKLNAKFVDDAPDDIFSIFAHQIEKISWIPHGMTGSLSADVLVGGGYDKGLDSLEISTRLLGKKLGYVGESVNELSIDAGVHKGILYGRNMVAKKNGTEIFGFINYYPNSEFDYSLESSHAKLRHLDHIGTAGLPIDGIVNLKSSGKGSWEKLKSSTRIDINNFFVRTRSIPDFHLDVETSEDKTVYSASLGGKDVNAELQLGTNDRSPSHFKLVSKNADYDYLLCLLNRTSCNDESATLNLDADADFDWMGSDWQHMSGSALIKKLFLEKESFNFRNAENAKLSINNGKLDFSPLTLRGDGTSLVFNAGGQVDGKIVSWSAKGQTSFHVLELFSAFIEEAKGKLNVDVAAAGSIADAKFVGNIVAKDGSLRVTGMDATLDNIQGDIQLNGSRASFLNTSAQLGGGTAQVSGYVDIFLNKQPKFNLDLLLANNRIKFYPINYAEIDEGRLGFTGDAPPYLFGGTVKVRKVMMRNNFDVAGQKSSQNARYLPEKMAGASGFYELKIRATAEDGVIVQNDLLDAEFKGECTLLNTFEYPQIIARAELVKGKLLFRRTPFNLDHAFVSSTNPDYFNPQFSIGGTADVDIYHINLFASGTVDAPKMSLSANPPLAQEDIISLLAFGFKGEDTKSKVSATNTSAITYSEMGSILLEQFKLSHDLESKGVKLTVVPSILQSESNIIRPNSTPDAVSPKVYLQTQLLKKVDASFGSTLGTSQSQELDASLQYKLSSKASLNAVYEEEPTDIDATERIQSYGADLKFRWGFK